MQHKLSKEDGPNVYKSGDFDSRGLWGSAAVDTNFDVAGKTL